MARSSASFKYESNIDFLTFCQVDAKIMLKTGENIIVQLPVWIEDTSLIEALMLAGKDSGGISYKVFYPFSSELYIS